MLDLDVSGKDLTDEGFNEVASALVEAINYDGDHGNVARLEELCLRSNRLTIVSLQALTPVIRVSCHDLRDLDLSDNHISISTDGDVAIWEDFLTSFEQCCVLRRIDLSGNALGDRASEVMLRVYAREEPIDLALPQDIEVTQHEEQNPSTDITRIAEKIKAVNLGPDAADHSVDEGHQKRKFSKQGNLAFYASRCPADAFKESRSPEKAILPASPAESQPLYTTTRGLRSVPYLILQNTAMTDTSALHLSYIIAVHHTPYQLLARVPPAKAGLHAQQLTDYDNHSQCKGIVYLPNTILGSTGLKLLELADTVRKMPLKETVEEIPEIPQTAMKSSIISRRPSNFQSPSILVACRSRRRSIASGGESVQVGESRCAHIVGNLDRARSRIQGDALQEAGPRSNDLWRVALNMLCLGRDLQVQAKKDPLTTLKAKAPVVKTLTVGGPKLKTLTLKSPMPLTLERDSNRPTMPWGNFSPKSPSMPRTSHVLPRTPSQPVALEGRQQTLPVGKAGAQPLLDTHRSSRVIVASSRAKNKAYQTQLPCGFSEEVWRRIIGLAAGASGIMSTRQQRTMLSWALDRNTLSKESEILGLTLASQIWRVLEGTGCLTYDMDA